MEENAQLHEENQRLKRAVEERSILNELASAIGGLNNSEEVVRKILSRALRALNAEQGVVTLIAERPDNPVRTLVRSTIISSEHPAFYLNNVLLGWMTLNKRPITVNDPGSDARFTGAVWDMKVRSLVCVPMLVRSGLKGILTVYNKRSRERFTDDDQRLLSIIAAQSAQVIENARLYEEERSLMKIQRELDLASEIQNDLLPKGKPEMPGYDMAGATFPARSVGGDFFDFIPIEDRWLALCDGILNGPSNTLLYCNAGHEPPYMFEGKGEPRRLEIGGTVIGAVHPMSFEGASVSFGRGDFLVAYSDGVTEAVDENRIQFGEAKLSHLIRDNAGLSAAELVKLIADAVMAHASNAPQYDDITALVIKREK